MRNLSQFIVPFLFIVLFFSNCKKKAEDDIFSENFKTGLKEHALTHASFEDVTKMVENLLLVNNHAKTTALGAPLGCITNLDTIAIGTTQKLYTVVFENSCTSYDGKYRSGTLYIDLQGSNMNDSASLTTIRFGDFTLNGNRLSGKITILNNGSKGFLVKVSDEAGDGFAGFTFSGSENQVQWKGTYVKKLTVGGVDGILLNNVYSIENAPGVPNAFEGVATTKISFTGAITTNLKVSYSCFAVGSLRYPIEGIVNLDMEVIGLNRSIDYGSGSCDAVVTMVHSTKSAGQNLY